MLTRLRFKRDFRLIVRCLSDKPSDSDGKAPESKTEAPTKDQKLTDANKKIQELLKSMLTAKPKISESDYSKNFTVAPERQRKPRPDEIERTTEQIEENLTKAAGNVAQAIGGNVKQTEAELLSKVLGKIDQSSTNLSDLLIGMKVDRSKETDDNLRKETRGQQVRRLVNKSKPQESARYTQRKTTPVERTPVKKGSALQQSATVDIFSGEPLNIFKTKETNYGTKLELWESLKQREVGLATAQPPANYFEKMIMWTNQGKVWKFPINNEQGLEEEENIHFSEHIFLDAHLEDWCPKKGPIRHFMELVCVGLSKNAFYTAKEKKDHIMWYKEYFESKKDILTEVGVWDVNVTTKSKPEAST